MVSNADVRGAVTPLRMIFWGGLLCILDLTFTSTVNGEGFKFDLLDDTVGAVLITVGVVRLRRIPVGGQYRKLMGWVQVAAVVSIADTALKHFVFPKPAWLSLTETMISLLQLAGIVGFCIAMRWLCMEAGLTRSLASWKLTMVLFVAIYAIPLGLLYLAGFIATATETTLHLDLGLAALLVIPALLVPPVHLFISTSRMRREAEKGIGPTAPRGFPVVP